MTNETATRIPFREYKANVHGNRSEEEAVSELTREIEVRRRLYDKWVAEGRLSWVDAHDRLSRLLSLLRMHTGAPLHEAAVTTSGDVTNNDPFA